MLYHCDRICICSHCQDHGLAVHVCMLSRFSHVQLCATLWTVACQGSLSLGFFKQKYWSGLPCPSPGYLSNPGMEPEPLTSLALAGGFCFCLLLFFLTTSATWEAIWPNKKEKYSDFLPNYQEPACNSHWKLVMEDRDQPPRLRAENESEVQMGKNPLIYLSLQ